MTDTSTFVRALVSPGPRAGSEKKLDLYGRFVGAWEFEAKRWTGDGKVLSGRGEIHFDWVLEGRAVQDIWILPARNAGPTPSLGPWTFYGTTLRLYDPGQDAWHIFWSDPRNQYYSRQLGRAEGDRIVQTGNDGLGDSVRWSFADITENSFRWLGERSHDGGRTWRLEVEFLARRTGPAA
jgi:hypothetical protein